MQPSRRVTVVLSLLSLYLIWGAAYFVIRVGIGFWPPLLLAGLRFLIAGMVLLGWARWQGCPLPTWPQCRSAALIGLLMVAIGNGCINLAETRVPSGVVAVILATDPLFITLFARLFGVRADRRQWLAILLGFVGILVLNQGSSLAASPVATLLLLLANLAWGLGSVLTQRLTQARGVMASATMMLFGGLELMLCSALAGERMTALPPLSGWLALVYLAVFASIIGFSAFLYLLKHVSTPLATSYAYVNPVVAELVGMWLLHEKVSRTEWLAMAIILASVLLILRHSAPAAPPRRTPDGTAAMPDQ